MYDAHHCKSFHTGISDGGINVPQLFIPAGTLRSSDSISTDKDNCDLLFFRYTDYSSFDLNYGSSSILPTVPCTCSLFIPDHCDSWSALHFPHTLAMDPRDFRHIKK